MDDDPLQLEHVIGFTGRYRNTVLCHPVIESQIVLGLGSNVVLQDTNDPHNQEFLCEHDEEISALAISSTGQLLASGQVGSTRVAARDAVVIVWDLKGNGHPYVYTLFGITMGVSELAFSHDEMFLAATGMDNSFCLWDMRTGEVMVSKKHEDPTTTLQWVEQPATSGRPKYALYATTGNKVRVHNLNYSVANMMYQVTSEDLRMPPGLTRKYHSSCQSPADNPTASLLVGTEVGDFCVYQLQDGLYRSSVSVCSGGVQSLCATRSFLFVGGGDGTVKKLRGDGMKWTLEREHRLSGSITSLTLSASGEYLMAGTSEGKLFRLDGLHGSPEEFAIRGVVQSETSPLNAVAFGQKSSIKFATLSEGGILRVWDLSDYSVQCENRMCTQGGSDAGLCLVYDDHASDPLDHAVVTGWRGGAVRSFSATDGQQLWEIVPAHRGGVTCVCATALYFATGGASGGVRLWARSSRTQMHEFPDHMKTVTALIPDVQEEHWLHSCGEDRSVYTYDLRKEKRVNTHQKSKGGVFLAMTQRYDSENELITVGSDGHLITWDCDEDVVGDIVEAGKVELTCAQVSPLTGRYLAVGGSNMEVKVWNLHTNRAVALGTAHSAEVRSLSWSPDEKQLVTVGADKCIAVWNFFGEDDDENKESH